MNSKYSRAEIENYKKKEIHQYDLNIQYELYSISTQVHVQLYFVSLVVLTDLQHSVLDIEE